MQKRLRDGIRRDKETTAGLTREAEAPPASDPPNLRTVIKETLRLGMANPTRLTRVVPATGLQIGATTLPPRTVVGYAAYTFHHDSSVVLDLFLFWPERWLDHGHDEGLRRPGMERSITAFSAGSRMCIGKKLAQQQFV
ncbi:MAG: hypothetical protein Q9188_004053 [Gyalolechia gomerana]